MNELSRVIKCTTLKWDELHILQPKKDKALSVSSMSKLKKNMQQHDFSQPFYVWQSGEVIWSLDGKARIEALQELKADGINIPALVPAVFIACQNKKEAIRLASLYAALGTHSTQIGFAQMLQYFDVDNETITNNDDPEIIKTNQAENVSLQKQIERPATLKITFTSNQQLEKAKPYVEAILQDFDDSFIAVSSHDKI